jgi:hypothetical protein
MRPFRFKAEVIDSQANDYAERIKELTESAVNGDITESAFKEDMKKAIAAAFLLAFLAGAGVEDEAQLSPEQFAAMNEQMEVNIESVDSLAADIYSGAYSPVEDGDNQQTAEEGLEKLATRALLWVASLLGVYHLGQEQAPPVVDDEGETIEVTYTWHVGNTEHCVDCLALDGVTLTASEWAGLGIRPQSPDLACGGWRCQCSRTNDGLPSDGIGAIG